MCLRPVQLNNLVDEIFYDFFCGAVGKNNKIIVNLCLFLFSVGKIAYFFVQLYTKKFEIFFKIDAGWKHK